MKIKVIYYSYEKNIKKQKENKKIEIYVLGIKVKKIYLTGEKKRNQIRKNNKSKGIMLNIQKLSKREKKEIMNNLFNIIRKTYISKFKCKLGMNTNDEILNTYVITLLSIIISFFVAIFAKDIAEENIDYEIYKSQQNVKIEFESIIQVNVIQNIFSIFKIIMIVMKGGKLNGNKASN